MNIKKRFFLFFVGLVACIACQKGPSINDSEVPVSVQIEGVTNAPIPIQAGHRLRFPYSVSGAVNVSVECNADNGWTASIEETTPTNGFLIIRAPYPYVDGTVTLSAKLSEGHSVSKSLSFVEQESTPIRYSYVDDATQLEGWSELLVISDGTFLMGKTDEDTGGYVLHMGNALDEESFLVYYDKDGVIREVFDGETIIGFVEENGHFLELNYTSQQGGIQHARLEIESNAAELTDREFPTRGFDPGKFISGFELFDHVSSAKDAVELLTKAKNPVHSLSAVASFLLHHMDGLNSFLDVVFGVDLSKQLNVDTFFEWSEGITDLIVYARAPTIPGLLMIYANLGIKYYELYNEHIEAYYGNCEAQVDYVDVEKTTAEINVIVSGHENWQNTLQVGIAVSESFHPSFSERGDICTITHNGTYPFTESGLKPWTRYHCRPYVVDKSRDALWIGLLGKISGPFIRYGKDYTFSTPPPSVTTGDLISASENSATVGVEFDNIPDGASCGVEIDGTRKITTSADSKSVTITGLDVATEYSYRAYVDYNGETFYGTSSSFTTMYPDVTGTWVCTEKHYRSFSNEEYYESYSVVLYPDGSASWHKEGSSYESASWSQEKYGLHVYILRYSSNSSDQGVSLDITFTDYRHPTHGVGTAMWWVYNSNTGGGNTNYYELSMTH